MEIALVYSQFRSSLLSFIRSKIRSKDDAEDILQNVFLRVSLNIEKLSDEEKLRSWIFSITRNAIIDYYRRNASAKETNADESIFEEIADEKQVDSTQGLDQCIHSMVKLLPDEYREVITESELKGVSQKELAEKTGQAYPTVRSKVQRGREKLKQIFYNCCHIETDGKGNIIEAQKKSSCSPSCDTCNDN